jgi:linearmycin/streptolysin S transport system ATP-binding protein
MLTLTDLRKSFGSIVAIDDLSLSVRRGEVFGLLGPNGAGKSTTVSLAVGLLTPDAGQVRIEGLGDPVEPKVRQRIGVATQALALYDLLTANENLRFFGAV